MEWIACEDIPAAELTAAEYIARRLDLAVHERGRASLAISGGRTPWGMLDQIAAQPLAWESVQLFQVDERIAPAERRGAKLEAVSRRRARPSHTQCELAPHARRGRSAGCGCRQVREDARQVDR